MFKFKSDSIPWGWVYTGISAFLLAMFFLFGVVS